MKSFNLFLTACLLLNLICELNAGPNESPMSQLNTAEVKLKEVKPKTEEWLAARNKRDFLGAQNIKKSNDDGAKDAAKLMETAMLDLQMNWAKSSGFEKWAQTLAGNRVILQQAQCADEKHKNLLSLDKRS